MAVPENEHIKAIFLELADLLEFLGENHFKVLAYRKSAKIIGELSKPVSELIAENKFESLPGIGKIILRKTIEILKSGKLQKLEELRSQVPESIRKMIKALSISPSKVACLVRNGIDSIEKLKSSLENGTIEKISDLGEQSKRKIKEYFNS